MLLENGQPIEYEKYQLHPIITAGDKLTSARIRGAQASHSHGDNSLEKLDGFVPATGGLAFTSNCFEGMVELYFYENL